MKTVHRPFLTWARIFALNLATSPKKSNKILLLYNVVLMAMYALILYYRIIDDAPQENLNSMNSIVLNLQIACYVLTFLSNLFANWLNSRRYLECLKRLGTLDECLYKFGYQINYKKMNLDNLQELTLSHNQLSSLGFVKKLEELKLLDVSHNRIVALTSQHFNNLTQLQVLDLSHNQLAYPQIFQKFNIPERHPPLQISLAFNKLTHLVIEENNFRQHIVFLYGNPWNCKCWQMMEKFMLDNKVKRNVCDLKFFGNGDIPYCIEFDKSDCRSGDFGKDSNISQRDIQNFVKVVEGSLDMIRCRLTPRIL